MQQSPVQKLWTAFHANDTAAFSEALTQIKDTSFLSNSENPVPCQAAKKGQWEILKAVLRVDPWACVAVDPDFRSPVHLAAINGSAEACQALFDSKPPRVKPMMLLKQTDNFKMTPLHCALLSGNEELVLYLLDYGEGAGAESKSKDGLFPIQMAVSKGMLAAVSRLSSLPGTEKVNGSVDKNGSSLLHRAATEGFAEVVEVLVANRTVDPNIQDKTGSTALHLAFAFGHDHVAALLKPVTDLTLTDEDGRTPEDCIPAPLVCEPQHGSSSEASPWQLPSVVTWTIHQARGWSAGRQAWARMPSVVTWTVHRKPSRAWSQLPSVVTWRHHVPRSPPDPALPRTSTRDPSVEEEKQVSVGGGSDQQEGRPRTTQLPSVATWWSRGMRKS